MTAQMNHPHLNNAPITEALIDLRVQLPEGFKLSELEAFCGEVHQEYPTKMHRKSWTGLIRVSGGGRPEIENSEPKTDGFVLKSESGLQVVQARMDGFTFSRLQPYETWEKLRDEARRLWALYVRITDPQCVTRIAVRYVNKINLPIEDDFTTYLTTGVQISPELPQAMSGLFLRCEVPFDNPKAQTIITQTLGEPSGEMDSVPYVFDIDVYRMGSPCIDLLQLWNEFDELRDVKNQVFFGSITKATVEMLK